MTDETYNGWENYQTWAVSMFLDGNYTGPETPQVVLEIVKGITDLFGPDVVRVRIADALKCFVRDEVSTLSAQSSASLTTDLLGHALDSVDWLTLAEHKIEEANEA